MGATTSCVMLLLLVLEPLLAVAACESCHASYGLPKYYVHIVNNLSNNILHVHCKSRDSNLGWHALKIDANFHFHFRVNFIGTTLFWCVFEWGNNRGRSYRVFWNGKGLEKKCNYMFCIWSARDDAIYLRDFHHNDRERYYDWER